MERSKITLSFDGKTMDLKTALVGGIMADGTEFPMGMYAGKLEIGEVGIAAMHCLRALIKINVDQHKMSVSESEEFVLICLAEAAKRERNKQQDVSYEEHQTFVKMEKENL